MRAIDFPKAQQRFALALQMSINPLSRRMLHLALRLVPHARLRLSHILETILTQVQLGTLSEVVRIRRIIPRVHLVPSELDLEDVPHLGELLVLAQGVGVDVPRADQGLGAERLEVELEHQMNHHAMQVDAMD